MQIRANDPSCDSCHAPLGKLTDPGELAVNEGVTCEACHAIRDVVNEGEGVSRYRFGLAENKKFGPLCDAKDNYFHKMGCAPVFREAKICGGCHALGIDIGGGKRLPIFEEYAEWASSSFATAGIACQACHMPEGTGHVATGATREARLGHHGFMGTGGDLTRKALGVVVNAREEAYKIVVDVALNNEGAGHAVPSGMPGRQVVLRVRALDEKGHEQAREEKAIGRVLVDEKGVEVPFYAARAEASDDRIAPGQSRLFVFTLDAPLSGSIDVEVAWRSASPSLTKALSVPAEERPMAKLALPFGEKRAGKARASLPKTMVYKP